MDKDYLDRQYRQAVLEYRAAKNPADQWQARQMMARLERTAAELFGFEFADDLHHKHCDPLRS